MGTSSSAGELASKLTRMGTTGVPTALRTGIEAAALETKIHGQGVMSAHGLPVGGGWRNMGATDKNPGGAKYGLRYSIRGPQYDPYAFLWLWGGPAYVVERGAKAHKIDTTKTNRRRKNKARSLARQAGLDPSEAEYGTRSFLFTPYGPRRSVNHPGLSARPYWRQIEASARVSAPRTIARATSLEMAKQFST